MQLNPVVEASRPKYPEGPPWRRGLLRNLRRLRGVAAAGVVAGGLWIGGCYGVTPIGSEPPVDADVVENVEDEPREEENIDADMVIEDSVDADIGETSTTDAEVLTPEPEPTLCEPEERMSGLVAPIEYFVCSWDDPPPPTTELPLHLGGGGLCAGGAAVGWFSLPEPARIRIGLIDYAEAVHLTVMNAEGSAIAEVGPGLSCIELDVEPDAVGLAAESAISPAPEYGYFEFYIDVLDDSAPDPAS